MQTLDQILERGHAGHAAIAVPGSLTLSYMQLRDQVSSTADQLRGFDLGRSDAIAIVFPNTAEAVLLFLAAARVGVAAPLNPAYKPDEFRFYLEDTQAKALIVPPGGGEAARQAASDRTVILEASLDGRGRLSLRSERGRRSDAQEATSAPVGEDVALVLHTSGTTSRPKLVPLRQQNLAYSAQNIAKTYALSPDDVSLCVMPLFHIHGLMASTMATFASGGTVVIPSGGFDAMTFWQTAEDHRITWYSAVPTIHQMLLLRHRGPRPAGSRSIRFVRSSSSALAPEVMSDLESRFGAPVIEAYGMTEASHQMASNPLPPGERRPGTVGRQTGIEIAIMGDDEMIVPAGERGEVVIKGRSIIDGYANNPEANATSFSGSWFRTGDLGMIDADGYLWLIGRLKEMINRGGEKIAPREIDEVLLQHPAVAEAIAFGLPHPSWGEEVAVAVVLKTEATEKELIAFARARLADYKVPRKLFIVAQIPRTATGKIQRRAVAERFR
jgi:oxalate---CoA ligase